MTGKGQWQSVVSLSAQGLLTARSSHRTRIDSTRQSRDISKAGENAIGMTYLLLTWV